MAVKLEVFQEYFEEFEEQYAVIGGTACMLLFGDAGLQFRATQDIDMVICVDEIGVDFGRRLSDFLEAGKYKTRQKADGERAFYRFVGPEDFTFPKMIELFARRPIEDKLPDDFQYVRIPVEEDILSLSGILLDDNYYDAMQGHRRVIDGIPVVDIGVLVPFKIRAFLDLTRRREEGEQVKSDDIKKHKNDVFRLLQLFPGDMTMDLAADIRRDVAAYMDAIEKDDAFNPPQFGGVPKDQGLGLLRQVYL